MTKLKFEVENIEDVPEQWKELYEQTEEKTYRLACDGAAPKHKIDQFRSRNIELLRDRERLEKTIAEIDPKKVEEIVAARTADITQRLHRTLIERHIAQLASENGVVSTAVDDVVSRANGVFTVDDTGSLVALSAVNAEGGDTTEPIKPATWLTSLKTTHPHYFATSSGGGAAGNRGNDGRFKSESKVRFKSDLETARAKSDYIHEFGFSSWDKLPLKKEPSSYEKWKTKHSPKETK